MEKCKRCYNCANYIVANYDKLEHCEDAPFYMDEDDTVCDKWMELEKIGECDIVRPAV